VLARIGLVIVFDDLDLLLAVLELQAAAVVDLLGPEFDVRPLRHGGAAGQGAGLRSDRADFIVSAASAEKESRLAVCILDPY
jgi:hypothetical protein